MRGHNLKATHVFLHGDVEIEDLRPLREGERPIEPIDDGWETFSKPKDGGDFEEANLEPENSEL